MTQRIRQLLPLLFVLLSACSTSQGFDRAGMQDTLHQRMPLDRAAEIKTTEIANAMESRPPFARPFRLGVYFVRTEFPTRQSAQSGEWLSAEKDQLVQRLAQAHTGQTLRDIVVLAEPTVQTLTRKELRQASIRYGIDVLVLVDGIGAVDRHNNAYALLYPTILGAWLAPGTISDALFVMSGRVWDVRADAGSDLEMVEGKAQRVGAAVLVEDAETLKEAKHLAIEAFGTRVVERLRALTAAQTGNASTPQ